MSRNKTKKEIHEALGTDVIGIGVCGKGIVGFITKIEHKNGRNLYKGFTIDGKKWQSLIPEPLRFFNDPVGNLTRRLR